MSDQLLLISTLRPLHLRIWKVRKSGFHYSLQRVITCGRAPRPPHPCLPGLRKFICPFRRTVCIARYAKDINMIHFGDYLLRFVE
jgi:hypothetical protein